MRYRQLGASGLRVSVLTMGAGWQLMKALGVVDLTLLGPHLSG
jgi:aryl-alcohol dehydrogenase-like predicted oxidoreductase